MTIRVRHLKLTGALRSYDVSFVDEEGVVHPFAVIAGEISTGKTSILQFIAYCLGRNSFPSHPEIRRSVTAALLEIEMGDTVFVIERSAVERPSRTATIHSCSIDELDRPHKTEEVDVGSATGVDSLSHFYLSHLNISEIELKEAPTQAASGVDRLSVRDLLRLVYVRYEDLGQENLLRENQPHVRLKYEQAIDVLFDAHDNRAASVAAEVQRIRADIEDQEASLATIEDFLDEQQVPDPADLAEDIADLEAELESRRQSLSELESKMSSVADFGQQQRLAHQAAAASATTALNRRRSIATQIERLTSLAAQYDQDVKKLTFAETANSLFDPLLISVCPWCFQTVDADDQTSSDCRVCHQPLAEEGATADSSVDISRELRAVRKRRNELADYLAELSEEARESDREREIAEAAARDAEHSLDEAMRGRFSPFIDQRDSVVGSIAALDKEREQLNRFVSMHASADRRRTDLGRMRQDLAGLSDALTEAEKTTTTRAEAVLALGDRFDAILQDFRFPKLSDPVIDGRYVPFARGQRYDELGSAGARTLVTLAWYLAIFELAVESDGPHPGVLLIDSPQKGLRPAPDQESDEFQDPSIAESVYAHLIRWSRSSSGQKAQVIVVDNSPQPIAAGSVIVDFTADADRPPYGLIEDATE